MTTQTDSDKDAATAMPGGTDSGVEPMGLKDAASGVADEAGRTLETTAARSMTKAGDVLHQVAGAVRQSSETLQADQPQVGRFISMAADKLDEAATFVSDREPTQLMGDAQQVARRQPALVIGGALVAGLLVGRVLRSAGGQPSQSETSGQDWYAGGATGGAAGRSKGLSDVSSGYGTGYGASYDRNGNGAGHLTGGSENVGSDPAAS